MKDYVINTMVEDLVDDYYYENIKYAQDLSKSNKIYPMIQMLKKLDLGDLVDDGVLYGVHGLVDQLKPYQEEYYEIKDILSSRLIRENLGNNKEYLEYLEFLQKEMNEVYQKFVFVLQKKHEKAQRDKEEKQG